MKKIIREIKFIYNYEQHEDFWNKLKYPENYLDIKTNAFKKKNKIKK